MVRAIFLFIKIGLIVAAALYLAKYPGRISLDWQGWHVDISASLFALGLLVFVILAILFARFSGGVLGAPGRFMENRRIARRERGYKALTKGLVAVAAGDPQEARRFARKADSLLHDPPLTRLLTAQAAQLEGDSKAATKYFEEMLEDQDMAFLGTRGLLMQAISDGDTAKARQLAEKAFNLRPSTGWAARHLLDLQREGGDLDAALKTADTALRYKALPEGEGKRTKAKLLIAKAQELRSAGDHEQALKLSNQANKLADNLPEGVTLSARLLALRGKDSKAARVLEDAWSKDPDPAISRAYRDIAPEGASPLEQVKRFEHLLSLNPNHTESHIALAEAALKAGLWGEARNHLDIVAKRSKVPGPRICRLMAELEESEHGDLEKARYWLAIATGEDAVAAE
ncbi:heme biosynthesis protein HemY [Hwanghaeella grinnelliae]|uniref:Heme biosynthesis protein HemY n=1 Tax=Hwanghaeella grinnelliae TaxID=2500179 RepID=A0A437QPF3_9PROT|nr:heme biosynthesis HemY N-terminal domain-containing protein [Hwanghaeella grinnelliae]RVU36413.1 heme biosynthesis protein HemY [Hwanghaeella grinnelliae]